MGKENTKKWLIVGGALVFWLILDAVFGAGNVRSGLRVFVLVVLVIGVLMTIVKKLSRTSRAPIAAGYRTEQDSQRSQGTCVYGAIFSVRTDALLIVT